MAAEAPGAITADEAAAIARMIEPELDRYASRYDAEKYSPEVLRELRELFSRPAKVGKREIERALRWKFGHRDKVHIPEAHARLIEDLAALWPRFVSAAREDPEQVCRHLLGELGRPHAFASVAFLAHLICGDRAPIIDQHNLRSVNHFLRQVRPQWRNKRKPDCIEDLYLLREFLDKVAAAWPAAAPPRYDRLDRFLMMYGKALKSGTVPANRTSAAAGDMPQPGRAAPPPSSR